SQEPLTSGESLNVQLTSLDLLTDDDSASASLTPSVSSVDLFGNESSDTVMVAESVTIPIGSYQQIAVRMGSQKPIRYRDASGRDHNVNLEDSASTSFYVAQTYEVKEGETTSILVNLDPYRSIQTSEQGNYVFRPKGDARDPQRGTDYKGTTVVSNAKWVCAYAFSANSSPEQYGPRPSPDGKGPPPPRGPEVEGRKTYPSKNELMKDTTDACDNAFAKAPVQNGRFELRHLLPATYALRVFTAPDSYQDIAEDLRIDARPRP
ncbi:MAG: DUF4382 domain-containing protein, partial [Proteobacteria bacterium]